MRERFARFMAGRYGTDQLNRFMLITVVVCMLLGAIFNGTGFARVLWLIALVGLILTYLRMFSKDRYKRAAENNKYLSIRYKLKNKFAMLKERWVQRKDYKFFSCPSCRTTLRVPRGKGQVNIVCRKCGTSFRRKT